MNQRPQYRKATETNARARDIRQPIPDAANAADRNLRDFVYYTVGNDDDERLQAESHGKPAVCRSNQRQQTAEPGVGPEVQELIRDPFNSLRNFGKVRADENGDPVADHDRNNPLSVSSQKRRHSNTFNERLELHVPVSALRTARRQRNQPSDE